MGCLNNLNNNSRNENIPRKIYIDLLSEDKIQQPEDFCDNTIKTTRYTL